MIKVKMVRGGETKEMSFATIHEALPHFCLCQSNVGGLAKITPVSVTRESVSIREECPMFGLPEDITYTGPEKEMTLLLFMVMGMFLKEKEKEFEEAKKNFLGAT